jgi:hypothetical protein
MNKSTNSKKMPKKYNYFSIDAGFFKVRILLCFSNKEFQKILKDHDINIKADALDIGVGETHYIADGRDGIVVVVFDLDACDDGPAFLAGVIAHEATHAVCRIFEHIGEDIEDIGEETRAYLTEHIVAQLTQGVIIEKEKNARKANRAVPKPKGEASGGLELQVDINGDGSAGQDSVAKQEGPLRGAKDGKGDTVPKAAGGVQGSRKPGIYHKRNPKQV